MPYTKRIVCLANSRKLGGYCFAGKEILKNGFGGWVRPVSHSNNGGLAPNQIAFSNGILPCLLDIVAVPFVQSAAIHHQKENQLIDMTRPWTWDGSIQQGVLPQLVDNVSRLWVNGFSSSNGFNDRVAEPTARYLNSSLLLIRPDHLELTKEFGINGQKVRAQFRFARESYRLVVTDPIVEMALHDQGPGAFSPISGDKLFLCISLGEFFNGFAYKLVAGMINFVGVVRQPHEG